MPASVEAVNALSIPLANASAGRDGTGHPRPRERMFAGTPAQLATADLVTILVGSGLPGRAAGVVAADLLAASGGLRALAGRTAAELSAVCGLGAVRAARLLAAIELGRRAAAEPLIRGAPFRGSADVYAHYRTATFDLRVEQFRVILLDGKHRIMREEMVSQGTLTSSPVHPREVFAPAVRHSCAAVVLAHNHPSGDPTPSADDLEITRRLVAAGELLGIRVLDHVIVGDVSYVSLADRGLLR